MANKSHLLAGFSALVVAVPTTALASEVDSELSAPSQIGITDDQKTSQAVKLAANIQPKTACGADGCKVRLTPDQLVKAAEKLVFDREFEKAAPLIEALKLAPGYKFQHRFLKGYIASETGKYKEAEKAFRAILNDQPKQTRVRLELARVMMLQGKEGSANYHFRLAQQDGDLPEEIRQQVTGLRGILRSQRNWRFNFDVGIAPDTNINSATSAETVNINFGPFQLPLTLSEDARQKSGIGQTAGLNAGLRLKASKKAAVLVDLDARMVNYDGKAADDIQVQLAAGPELRLGATSSLSLQALGEKRWYGGRSSNLDFGARLGFQKILDEGQRISASIDGRNRKSDFSPVYSGWIVGSNVTYERVIGRSFIASAGLFGRKDLLESKAFSNTSFGGTLGIGGELPLGINAGVSGSVSRAIYDAPQFIYSNEDRKDLRLFGRAYVGMRSFKFMGFSPSVEYSFSKVNSNYDLYRNDRHRMNFKLARYF